MSAEYRISLWCGVLPLVGGVSIFALWYLTRAEFLAQAGLALLGSGWMLIVLGLLSLFLHLREAHHLGVVSRRQLVRQGLLSGGLLLANIPAAAAILVAAAHVATTYTVRVQDQSGEMVFSHCRPPGGGVGEASGTLRSGESVGCRLRFSEDGVLVPQADLGDRTLSGTVEDYVTSGQGGDATDTIQPDGAIRVERQGNND